MAAEGNGWSRAGPSQARPFNPELLSSQGKATRNQKPASVLVNRVRTRISRSKELGWFSAAKTPFLEAATQPSAAYVRQQSCGPVEPEFSSKVCVDRKDFRGTQRTLL